MVVTNVDFLYGIPNKIGNTNF